MISHSIQLIKWISNVSYGCFESMTRNSLIKEKIRMAKALEAPNGDCAEAAFYCRGNSHLSAHLKWDIGILDEKVRAKERYPASTRIGTNI